MKKHLLSTLCVLALAGQNLSAEEPVNGLEFVAQNYKTSFFNLSLGDQAGTVAFGLFGGACTYLAKKGIENVLHTPEPGKRNPIKFLYPSKWSLTEKLVVPAGALWVTKIVGDSSKPEAVALLANANGLLNLLLECKTPQEVEEALDSKYVTSHFPRAIAFAQLADVRTNITRLLDLVTKHNTRRSKHSLKKITTLLRSNLKTIDTALLILKKDSRWFEECNAHTLKQAQNTHQNQQNAELTETAINLAHAYSR